MSLLLAVLMVLEVFSPVAVSAMTLLDEEENHTSIMSEPRVDSKSILGPETKPKKEPLDDELFSVPAKKAEPNKEINKIQEAPARQKESSILIETPAKEETAPQKEVDKAIIEAGRQREQKAEDKLNQAVERAKQAEQNAKASENLNLETSEIEKPGYKAWRVVNRIKAIYKDGKLDCQGLLIEVEDFKGNKKTLTYDDILKDENIIVNKEIKEGLFGSSELIITTPGLRDIKIDVKVENMKKDKKEKSDLSLEKENSNKLEDKENTEEKEEKEGLLDKLKETLGLTGLQKADKELKKALADEKNGLEEIQALLNTFEEKYELSREDQAKLMADNEEAIQKLIERDREENFRPQIFTAGEINLDGKKFNVRTIFQTSNIGGPIQDYQYFKIHLDEKLTVKEGTILEPITYNGRVIAKPSYDKDKNIITYNIEGTIPENVKIPLDIPVDYNTEKISNIDFDDNGLMTITNSVSGLGVTNPKSLLPEQIDKNGNPAGTILEPGRKDIIQITEPDGSAYKVYTDANVTPVINNGKLEGYNWTVKITSDTNLEDLGYKANFTTVKGSGLGEITSRDASVVLGDNPIKGQLGIVDSKHHAPTGREFTYNLYTPVTNEQESYMMDISVALLNKGKTGAQRILAEEGYPDIKVKEATPDRVGMNNRTTILGEFTSESSAKWTVTDGVSTKEPTPNLPYQTRNLGGNQTVTSSKVASYGLNEQGQMVVKTVEPTNNDGSINLDGVPSQGTNPGENQPVGTIAVYEYDTSFSETSKDPLTLNGVRISKHEDILIDQNWYLDDGLTMPAQKIQAVDPTNEEKVLGEVDVPAAGQDNTDTSRSIIIENAKVWNIGTDESGKVKATRIKPTIKQDLPKTDTIDGKTVNYYENSNYVDPNTDGTIFIHNRGIIGEQPKGANFTIVKKDGKDGKLLPGAKFKLLGNQEVITDDQGRATFSNVEPGEYILYETKAPNGYRLNDENPRISVDKDGRVSVFGGNASLIAGDNPTKTVSHGVYPDYMNAMQYAVKNSDGTTSTYIYLKANAATQGSTNKNTRLNLIPTAGGSITKVEVFDVDPNNQRENFKNYMTSQTVDTHISELGNSVLNVDHWNPITGKENVRDNYTGKTGYQIYLPKERFTKDWGFLVKVTGTGDSLSYDWLTDQNTGNEAMLQNQVIPASSADEGNKETTITITNQAFETRPVEIKKYEKTVDQNNKETFNPITGATFVIKDQDGNPISTVTVDEKGVASFGNLPEGNYVIEEIQAPEGYIKSDVVFDVTVDSSNQVTYKPRFKNGSGSPVNGEDYFLTDQEVSDTQANAQVTSIKQDLFINEGQQGDIGTKKDIWEAYMLESLKYTAQIGLSSSAPGQRFSIQFDRNLDFTQYFGEFPKLKIAGVEVADPYFDYTTNKLTYVFNDKSSGGISTANIELVGIIPSKYYAKNDGTYTFNVTVAPGQANLTGNTITRNIKADYGYYDYDRKNVQPTQSYYFRDVYQDEKGQWYVKALAYYNPHHVRTSGEKELQFNWMSTNYQGANKNYFQWEGNGNDPAFSLRDVKIYRTSPDLRRVDNGIFGEKTINENMPLSFGVRPEQDPATYNLVYSRAIDPKGYVVNDRQGGVTLNYDPSQIQNLGVITKNSPLRIKMPPIDAKSQDGYIIEQTFKIDDMYKFNNLWRVFLMQNNEFKSSFITRANYNKATGDQTSGEIPKFYSQEVGLVNKKYTPGNFRIRKLDDLDRTNTLEGASFSLTNDETKEKIFRSSGAEGIVEFSKLKPGIYTLKEETAPNGHIKSDKTWRVNVGIDGFIGITEVGLGSTGGTVYGKEIILAVTNKPVSTGFKVYKKDDENRPLDGAEFKLTTKEGTEVATATSKANGEVSFENKLQNGKTYIIEETKAPAGYQKLDKKWVVEVGTDGKAKVYNYIQGPSSPTNPDVNKSILGVEGTNWVNVAARPTGNFIYNDNRNTGYYNNYPVPYKLGTRIVAKNETQKYVIQRYVINPEADTVTLKDASIHREKPWYDNMDWYAGNGVYKVFELDKKIDGDVENIRLENYGLTDLTKSINASKKTISGDERLYLDFNNRQITKPIVIDVKVPYTSEDGGVGTGMDLSTDKGVFWKSDYYEKASEIVQGDKIETTGQAGNIKGAYVSDDFLEVSNSKEIHDFSFTKVGEKNEQGGYDALSGATFKLQGPKNSDEDLGPSVWARGDAKGVVNFNNLTPGIYKLTETGAPQGYEASNTDWTVTVTKDGKIYIRDNNAGDKVPNTQAQYQKVADNSNNAKRHLMVSSSVPNTPSKVETKIVSVNKGTNKLRQVYIINRRPERLYQPIFEIHAQEENRPLNLNNTKILSVELIDPTSTFDNLKVKKSIEYDTSVYVKDNANKQERIKITPKDLVGEGNTIAVTIETEIPKDGTVGTGMDFINHFENVSGNNSYWASEWYDDLESIKLEPVTEEMVDKNSNLVVSDGNTPNNIQSRTASLETPLTNALLNPMKAMSISNFAETVADGLEIGDDLVENPVGAAGWQEVDPSKSTIASHQDGDGIQTKITKINKDTKEFTQVFLLDGSKTLGKKPIMLNYHTANGTAITPKNIRVYKVTNASTIDNLQANGADINYNGPFGDNYYTGNTINFPWSTDKYVVEFTVNYTDESSLGLEAYYLYDRQKNPPLTYWKYATARESYNSANDINKEETTYKVTPNVQENGTVTADPNQNIKAGQTVTLTLNPNNGFVLKTLEVNSTKGTVQTNKVNDTEYTFTMPDSDVTVSVYFIKPQAETFSITVNQPQNGSITANKERAEANEQVTLTVDAIQNYELESLTVKDDNGQTVNVDMTNYTFTMPASNVTVTASFKKVEDPTPETYTVTVTQPTEGGTISASTTSAAKDVEVTLSATPEKGYVLDKFTVTSNGQEIAVSGNKFKMPAANVTVSASFKKIEDPDPEQPKDPIDDFKPEEGRDILIRDGETAKLVQITNKKDGINPKIIKTDGSSNLLPGATFTIKKMTDGTYKTEDTSFEKLKATSDSNGKVIFTDESGKEVKLQKGYYILSEENAPTGYKRITADWKLEVKDENGKMSAVYKGPEDTPSSLIDDNTKANAGNSTDNNAIKYKSRLTYIDPEAKTFVQRIYVDTRGYTGTKQLNVQITPTIKREEKDVPSQPPTTLEQGVKTAYRTTYKLDNPQNFTSMTDPEIDKILRSYDLSNPDMSMVNTARWRPFDWGFDEDQLNLDKGVYIIDVEGYYDDNITAEDIGKIDLHVDFYEGRRDFVQLVFDEKQNKFVYEAFKGASYQGGAEALRQRYEDKLYAQYVNKGLSEEEARKQAKTEADAWKLEYTTINGEKSKYQNFIGKKVDLNGTVYDTGLIYPALPDTPYYHADTSININPLYNSNKEQVIPREGMEVVNEEEAYNITFSKHGRDGSGKEWGNNSEKVTNNRLEGAVFKLQVQGPGGIYEDIPGTTVASAFNGYFGFRGLKPGRYRLMEVKAPEGYRPIKDAIIYMTIGYTPEDIEIIDQDNPENNKIIPKGGYITLEYNNNDIIQYAGKNTEGSGQLVDFVTSATAKNMGKIINEKPGKGEINIIKKDGKGENANALEGAEFELRKLIADKKTENPDDPGTTPGEGTEKDTKVYETKTTDKDGKIVFEDLPIGQYELVETKPANGHQNKGQRWFITVGGEGLDPYAGDISPTGRNMSANISFDSSDMTVLRPRTQDKTQAEGDSIVRPNLGQQLSFENKFTVTEGNQIRPGDYFILKVSPNLDLEGIVKARTTGLDIFADGVGTIAKANYNKEAGTITYTFTEYANMYELKEFSNVITSYIQTQNVRNNANDVSVGFSLDRGNQQSVDKYKSVDVIYDISLGTYYDYNNYNYNLSSKIVNYDHVTGDFVHYYYVNPEGYYSIDSYFKYKPGEELDNIKIETFKLSDPTQKDNVMPDSYAVDESSPYLRKIDTQYNNDQIHLGTLDYYNRYLIKVTGRAKDKDLDNYKAEGQLYMINSNCKPSFGVETDDEVYLQSNVARASAKLEIKAINPKNEINFRKTDQDGKVLQGATFALLKDSGEGWQEIKGSERTTGTDGLIKYEKLSPGKYALIEKTAPTGYKKIEGNIVEFNVDENGVITRKVDKPVENTESTNPVAKAFRAVKALATNSTSENQGTPPVGSEKITEEVGITPIDVVNYKDVEFVKVDADDKNVKLKNAKFEVWYKETLDGEYAPYKVKGTVEGKETEVTKTVTSDKDGKFILNPFKEGYYALKEIKAPDGYTKLPGWIKEFRLLNGKIQVLEKDPLRASLTKGGNGKITSQITELDKENKTFTQRLIINPSGSEWQFDGPDTQLRIDQTLWNINTNGKTVKVAVVDDATKVGDLKDTDFKNFSPRNPKANILIYTIRDMYGNGNYTGPEAGNSLVTTSKTLVVDIQGKPDENATDVNLRSQVFFDWKVLDNIEYHFNVNQMFSFEDAQDGKGSYVDPILPIAVENRKAEYPWTGGMGTLIFTVSGLILMSAAAYVYSRKRRASYDE